MEQTTVMNKLSDDFKENSVDAQLLFADMITCSSCLALIPSNIYYKHICECADRSDIYQGNLTLSNGILGKYQKLQVCGCPLYIKQDQDNPKEYNQFTLTTTTTAINQQEPEINKDINIKEKIQSLSKNIQDVIHNNKLPNIIVNNDYIKFDHDINDSKDIS